MRSLVIHGKGSSPEKVEWLAKPLRSFGEVIVPDFEIEVKEGVEKALQYNFDCIAGHSRGGTIALIVGALRGSCVIAVSAPSDRRKQKEYLSKFPQGTIQHKIYEDLIKLPDYEFDYSPLKYADKLKDVLLIHGENDEIVSKEHSIVMCEEIKKYGGNCELHIIPNMKHTPLGQQYSTIWNIIENWIRKRLQNSSQ
ncbi:alpha/beta hydrolase family protein [Sulfurisphaera ohwakuensis]|uniref:Dipeptidyl aminopeptidase/acylaminoacyl peptidase n=1 Tax=Sulfurisphaera ohwakuensis TaxID=69656 RepID=A0A650CEN9_SULOH|nr:prolyl oligopeptidase family serine peptidase [Sulfurisphaera ohwakuensis]MBB5254392.1 dipeptidyl aminopeptidase/acylaminoacyl peptidase [Sulfurisphaera ohwakuensis]QGR16323.1 prolyl oligopeptidase family serine peptidase [Sulfurisphaera ohwakuensis]